MAKSLNRRFSSNNMIYLFTTLLSYTTTKLVVDESPQYPMYCSFGYSFTYNSSFSSMFIVELSLDLV